MEPNYWSDRWRRGEIAFHQKQANAQLAQFWPRLALSPALRVLVPLCGKSEDMVWLRSQGHTVVGIELSDVAIAAFFAEHGLEPTKEQAGSLWLWSAAGYELYVGDFFDLSAKALRGAQAIYDRAALIALPSVERHRYARHLAAIMPADCKMLLMTVDYPQERMSGPPFAVSESEVRALYGPEFSIQTLASRDILDEEPRFRARGLDTLAEQVFMLTRTSHLAPKS